jgi:hypothetical protein
MGLWFVPSMSCATICWRNSATPARWRMFCWKPLTPQPKKTRKRSVGMKPD